MRISLIAAMAANRVIGIENRLPWHLPADLKHFKALTMGKPIVMGRKTFESLGRPLPGRRNIVVSRNAELEIPGCEVVDALEQALALTQDTEEVMIIGGAQLFALALPMADVMYLTLVEQEIAGDSFFPQWKAEEWREIAREDFDPEPQNPYRFSFLTLERTLKR